MKCLGFRTNGLTDNEIAEMFKIAIDAGARLVEWPRGVKNNYDDSLTVNITVGEFAFAGIRSGFGTFFHKGESEFDEIVSPDEFIEYYQGVIDYNEQINNDEPVKGEYELWQPEIDKVCECLWDWQDDAEYLPVKILGKDGGVYIYRWLAGDYEGKIMEDCQKVITDGLLNFRPVNESEWAGIDEDLAKLIEDKANSELDYLVVARAVLDKLKEDGVIK